MTDAVEKFFYDVLKDIGWPVSQMPGLAENETYITFQPVSGDGRTAGNRITRVRHLVQLHAYSRGENGEHRTAFFAALDALRAAGVRIFTWGPDSYDADTGTHHIACTCTWWQTVNDETEGQ